jgi:hypothetical protein
VGARLGGGGAGLAARAGMLVVGYGIAVLVGLSTARNPQSVAYLLLAAGGVLLALSALAGTRLTVAVAALLLVGAGGLLYRAGRLPATNDASNGTERPA